MLPISKTLPIRGGYPVQARTAVTGRRTLSKEPD